MIDWLRDSRWPRIENYRGINYCCDIVFLRPNSFGCTINDRPALAPEPDEELMSVRFMCDPLRVEDKERARRRHYLAQRENESTMADSGERDRSDDEDAP